jgi:manganese transport protein
MSADGSDKPFDPYALSPHDIQEPPTSLWAALRKIGPGIVLAGSIVGSGELILTTALGAEFGFAFLWLILYSCVIKVFVQIELGRYAISSGLPTLAALNALPGPRLLAHWLVWWWFIMLLATVTQLGGMIGGVSQAVHLAFPLNAHVADYVAVPTAESLATAREATTKTGAVQPVKSLARLRQEQLDSWSKNIWAAFVAAAIVALLLSGGYKMIEKLTTLLVVGVTAFTVIGVLALQRTAYGFTVEQVATGLMFAIPAGGMAKAFGCFGITGVGANELYCYPYWCIEKGYARWVGPRDDSEDWVRRAKGWLRVLYLDAWVSMLVFSAATIAFYFLGAAVLYPQFKAGKVAVPDGAAMIPTLSTMYVPSFGEWTRTAFLVGAWAVLFKTLYVSVAGHSRLTTDFFGLARLVRLPDADSRRVWIRLLCVFYPALALLLYLTFTNPKALVQFGAVVQAATLPIISCATLYLRYRRLDKRLAPSPISDALLLFAVVSITVVAAYALWDLFSPIVLAWIRPLIGMKASS